MDTKPLPEGGAESLDSQAAAAHAAPMDSLPARRLSGRLIFEVFIEEGGGLSFECRVAPVGRLTPAIIDRHLSSIYRALQVAQAEERQAALAPVPDLAPAKKKVA